MPALPTAPLAPYRCSPLWIHLLHAPLQYSSAKWLFDPSQCLHQPFGPHSSSPDTPQKTQGISDYRIHLPTTEILLISIHPCKMKKLSGL